MPALMSRSARGVVVFEAVVEGTELGRVGPVAQRRRGAAAEHRFFVQCYLVEGSNRETTRAGKGGRAGGGGGVAVHLRAASIRLVTSLIMGLWAGIFGAHHMAPPCRTLRCPLFLLRSAPP